MCLVRGRATGEGGDGWEIGGERWEMENFWSLMVEWLGMVEGDGW